MTFVAVVDGVVPVAAAATAAFVFAAVVIVAAGLCKEMLGFGSLPSSGPRRDGDGRGCCGQKGDEDDNDDGRGYCCCSTTVKGIADGKWRRMAVEQPICCARVQTTRTKEIGQGESEVLGMGKGMEKTRQREQKRRLRDDCCACSV